MRLRRRRERYRFWAGVVVGLLGPMTGLLFWFLAPAVTVQAAQSLSGAGGGDRTLQPVEILLLGVDEREQVNGSRTDTMLLVQVANTGVRVLSIPRDTLVHMEGHAESKINSAYTYGGAELAKQVTSDLVGIDVDYYATINLAGFRHLVDLMGGVQYDVPKAMQYTDPTDGTVIDLKPGPQKLDGQKAEEFVRFRHDEIGDDMGRIQRQQEFMKAAIAQALTPSQWLKLPQLISTARSYVQTDVPVTEQIRLAHSLYRAQQDGAVVQETLPGHGGYVDGISFFLLDKEEMQRLTTVWQNPGEANETVVE